MRIKRQKYQKQIRRQYILNIFNQKRLIALQSTYPIRQYNTNRINNYKLILSQWIQQWRQSLKIGKFEMVLQKMKDFYHKIKQTLKKLNDTDFVSQVIQYWFQMQIDVLLAVTVKQTKFCLQSTNSALRKEIFKYVLYHFYTIFQYLGYYRAQFNRKNIYQLLFIVLEDLSYDQSYIQKILVIVNNMMLVIPQVKYQIFFYNYNTINESPLTFQSLCYVMFLNRQKLRSSNFNKLKLYFIAMFRTLLCQIDNLKSYNQKNNAQRIHQNIKKIQCDKNYETILNMYNNSQQISIKTFLKKQIIILVKDILQQTKQFYLSVWTQSQANQEQLAQCVHVTRLIYQLYPKINVLKLENQASQLLDILHVKCVHKDLKYQILHYLDTIIFLDKQNQLTTKLIDQYNLFNIIWSYQCSQIFVLKANILSNMLLDQKGYYQINQYISQILIWLSGYSTPIHIINSFIFNYFYRINFVVSSSTNLLVIQFLYALDFQRYTQNDVRQDVRMFSHFYNEGWKRPLPHRYIQWDKRQQYINIIDSFDQKVLSKFLDQQSMNNQ